MPTHDDEDVRLATARIRLLARQLGEEMGNKYGWMAKAARKMGIGQTTLSKLLAEDRNVGLQTIAQVTRAMRLDPRFFSDPSLGDAPRYRDHLRKSTRPGADKTELPHWREFVERYPRIGELSVEDLDRIRANYAPDVEIRSWMDWAQLAEWLLGRRKRP